MIHDSLTNARIYRPLGPLFAAAFDFLAGFDPEAALGKVTLDGDRLFALVQSYVPTPAGERPFESHRAYADIQYVAAGSEIIQFSPLDRLRVTKPYSAEGDAALYSGTDDWPLFMRAGDFAILYPQDGHKPGCLWLDAAPVRKVVVKVRLGP